MHSWGKLYAKRVFITGASGFVGTWLVQSFRYANERLGLGAELVSVLRDSLPKGDFHYGIHAAKAEDLESDVALTKRVLDFAARQSLSAILLTSSGAAATPAETDYARAKRISERLFSEYAARCGFRAVIARLFTFLGPGLPLDANFAIGNFMRDVLTGMPINVAGDGSAIRSYMYAADLAIWLWTLLLEGKSAQPYNVGSPDAITISDLAKAVVQNTVPGVPIVTHGGDVPGAARVYVPDTETAQSEFGLRTLIPLDEGIRRMYRELTPHFATTP